MANTRSPNRPMRFNSSANVKTPNKSPARSRSTERLSRSPSKKEVTEGYTYGINPISAASTSAAATARSASVPSRAVRTTSTNSIESTTEIKAQNNAASAPTYNEASVIAADILSNILKQQPKRYSSPYAQRNLSMRTPSPHNNNKQYTPSTAHIHHQIVQYMKVHNLDPQVHYTSIIKAIKIHVLSTLLSNDLSQAEVQDTVDLIQSSPMRTNDGSNRLHRYVLVRRVIYVFYDYCLLKRHVQLNGTLLVRLALLHLVSLTSFFCNVCLGISTTRIR